MRFYEGKIPDNAPSPSTTPYCIATVVSSVPENTLDATQAGSDNLRIQFAVFGATKAEAKPVITTLRSALGPNGYETSLQEFIDPSTDLRMIAMDWEFWLLR